MNKLYKYKSSWIDILFNIIILYIGPRIDEIL